MANYDGKEGHWVTSNGRHIFISDDPAEKQEKEIAAQQEQTKRLTEEKQGIKKEKFTPEELKDIIKFIEKRNHESNTSVNDILQDIDDGWAYDHGYAEGTAKNIPIFPALVKYGEIEKGYTDVVDSDTIPEKNYDKSYGFVSAYYDKSDNAIYLDFNKGYDWDWLLGD